MSERKSDENTSQVTFDPILPDSGVLFYEECPKEYEIDPPILLALKSATQIRFEELQSEAVRAWKQTQKSAIKKE